MALGLAHAVISFSVRRRSFKVMRPSTSSTRSWITRHTERIEQLVVCVHRRTLPEWRSQKRESNRRPPRMAMASPTLICSGARASV
jgi:hypothetical protein